MQTLHAVYAIHSYERAVLGKREYTQIMTDCFSVCARVDASAQ